MRPRSSHAGVKLRSARVGLALWLAQRSQPSVHLAASERAASAARPHHNHMVPMLNKNLSVCEWNVLPLVHFLC